MRSRSGGGARVTGSALSQLGSCFLLRWTMM